MRTFSLSFLVSALLCLFTGMKGTAQAKLLDSVLPIRGLCINAPTPQGLDSFITFIHQELAPRKVNTLLLSIGYRYQFKSRPELTDSFALSKAEVKKIVKACREHHIRIIPEINLLGHQSWANHIGKLLKTYPQLDETPWVVNPVNYKWPNDDNLYCRSYCPLHPELHSILFPVIDELCDVFETNAFHAGMDEVFYIGEEKCPRCGGRDKAVLFAGEVTAIHDHLALRGRELWIWADRLIDGKTTGMGIWEASFNNTDRAVDLIPKEVVLCDWHYRLPEKSAVYFAMKGFRVVTCPWRQAPTGVTQVNDMVSFREGSTPEMKPRFYGIVETTWTSTQNFLNGFYGIHQTEPAPENTAWNCFRAVFAQIDSLGK